MGPDETPLRSRRSVLAASIGGVAALVVHTLGRPAAADAAAGDVIHVGDRLTTEVLTELRNEVNTESVFRVATTIGTALHGLADGGTAIAGFSVSGTGTTGTSNSGPGMFGRSSGGNGVHGESLDGTGVSPFSGHVRV